MTHIVDEPSVPSPAMTDPVDGLPHSHPLPRSLRIGAVVYGLVLGLLFASVALGAWLVFSGAETRRDSQIEAAKQGVLAELEERTAARDEQQAEQDADAAETRRLVDDLRRELAALRVLAETAGLDTSGVPPTEPRRPAPAASPAPAPPTPPQPGPSPASVPRPTGSSPATPRPSAAPSPAPSPLLCQVPLVGPGVCPRGRA